MGLLPPETQRTIGVNLSAGRQTCGLTLAYAARRMGLPEKLLAEVEGGRMRLTSAELQRLCRLYHLTMREAYTPPALH